jgi:hypothetical protein
MPAHADGAYTGMNLDDGRSRKGVSGGRERRLLENLHQTASQHQPSLFRRFGKEKKQFVGRGTEVKVRVPEMGFEKTGEGIGPFVGESFRHSLGVGDLDHEKGQVPAVAKSPQDLAGDVLGKVPVYPVSGGRRIRGSGGVGFLLVSWHGLSLRERMTTVRSVREMNAFHYETMTSV